MNRSRQLVFLVPGDWNVPTGGYGYDRRLVQALAGAAGNKARAARALGLPRSTFVSKLEKFGLIPKRA